MRRIKLKALKLLCLILALIFPAVGCGKKLTKPLELNKPIGPPESIQSLHEAVEKGNFSVVKALISDGADVNTRDAFGSMPLHLAAREGHIEVAELLIVNGADVSAGDRLGSTPLFHAANSGDTVMMNLLIESGAEMNSKGDRGWALLHKYTVLS